METVMDVWPEKRESQPKLSLDKNTRDALADYCRERWPSGTAKQAARAFDLSTDEARGVVKGRTSLTTYDKIKKTGGWSVVLSVESQVIGQGIDQFLLEQRASYEIDRKRVASLYRSWVDLASSGPDPDPDASMPTDLRRRSGRN